MAKTKKLTKKELEQYKNRLLELREKIGAEVGQIEKDYLRKSSRDASGDISSHPFHMADAATDAFDTEFNIGLASNEKNVLYEIDAALRRIKEGTFGICEKYGTPISKKRLKAMPYARYSIKAQEEEEKKRR
jgi:DnaK suppressor protein